MNDSCQIGIMHKGCRLSVPVLVLFDVVDLHELLIENLGGGGLWRVVDALYCPALSQVLQEHTYGIEKRRQTML